MIRCLPGVQERRWWSGSFDWKRASARACCQVPPTACPVQGPGQPPQRCNLRSSVCRGSWLRSGPDRPRPQPHPAADGRIRSVGPTDGSPRARCLHHVQAQGLEPPATRSNLTQRPRLETRAHRRPGAPRPTPLRPRHRHPWPADPGPRNRPQAPATASGAWAALGRTVLSLTVPCWNAREKGNEPTPQIEELPQSRYPVGCFRCQRQASSRRVRRSDRRGTQPSMEIARLPSLIKPAGSPSLAEVSREGTG